MGGGRAGRGQVCGQPIIDALSLIVTSLTLLDRYAELLSGMYLQTAFAVNEDRVQA
jgi:hypothetical protein